MNAIVIPIHRTHAAKLRGTAEAAYLAGVRYHLPQSECLELSRKASQAYHTGQASPARAVADAEAAARAGQGDVA